MVCERNDSFTHHYFFPYDFSRRSVDADWLIKSCGRRNNYSSFAREDCMEIVPEIKIFVVINEIVCYDN